MCIDYVLQRKCGRVPSPPPLRLSCLSVHTRPARCHKPPNLGIASGRFSRFLRSSIPQSYLAPYGCTHHPSQLTASQQPVTRHVPVRGGAAVTSVSEQGVVGRCVVVVVGGDRRALDVPSFAALAPTNRHTTNPRWVSRQDKTAPALHTREIDSR